MRHGMITRHGKTKNNLNHLPSRAAKPGERVEKMKTKIEKTTPDQYGHDQWQVSVAEKVIFIGSLIGACRTANKIEEEENGR